MDGNWGNIGIYGTFALNPKPSTLNRFAHGGKPTGQQGIARSLPAMSTV